MLCAKFGWNWPSGSWEEDFKLHQCISNIWWLSPLGNRHDPSFVQTQIPFIKGCFVPSLVEIGQVVLERKIFMFSSIYTILLLSPLGKRWGPSFEQSWIPFTWGCFVPSLIEIGPVVLDRKIFRIWRSIFTIS